MELIIKPATEADALLIADLSRQTFYETFAPHNTEEDMDMFLGEQFTRGRLMLEVGQPELHFFIAYANGEAVGYLKLREGKFPAGMPEKNALEITRIYVLELHAGKGIGKGLMQKSLEVAKSLQKESVWLGVWEKNSKAIDFYTSWGFTKFGQHDFLLGRDLQKDWLMEKVLCDPAP